MSIPALSDLVKDSVSAFETGSSLQHVVLEFSTVYLDTYKKFDITDASVLPTSKIVATVTWDSTLERDPEELVVDPINIVIKPLTGSFEVHASSPSGVRGKYGLTYQVSN